MTDIRDPRLLWAKFALFMATGALAVVIALLLFPSIKLALLISIGVWAFCRAYYFAFYVIEHYTDDNYSYAGLASFARHAWKKCHQPRDDASRNAPPTVGDRNND